MFHEEIRRRLRVCGEREAPAILSAEPGVWNVVSIRGPGHPRPDLEGAKAVCEVLFDDLDTGIQLFAPGRLATARDLERIFVFSKRTQPDPLLIHCLAGISRAPAVALGIIARALHPRAHLARDAAAILTRVRPGTMPNRLVLRIALEQFLPQPLAWRLADEMRRFVGLSPGPATDSADSVRG